VRLTTGQRKLGLTAHVASSVGWLGAVAVSLALAVTGLASQDPQLVRSVYLTLEPVGWFALVPLSIASLLTGLVQSLGTPWGLFRHYWILAKLVINVLATAVLLMYMQTLGTLADLASQAGSTASVDDLKSPSAVLHAGAAVVLLLTATMLSVYKPRGLTRYGQRKQQRDQPFPNESRQAQPGL
jgi:hypothetical protein